MINMRSFLKLLVIILSFLISACNPLHSGFELIIQVFDENGASLQGVEVRVAFEYSAGMNVSKVVRGTTNTAGEYCFSSNFYGVAFCTVRNPGFYEFIDKRIDCFPSTCNAGGSRIILKVVLQKVMHPVPMYVKQLLLVMPELNKPVGFDFECGDWVAPHGKGMVSHIQFLATRSRSDDSVSGSVSLTFLSPMDGLICYESNISQGSVLSSPQSAPKTGYTSKWERSISISGSGGARDSLNNNDLCYILSINNELDKNFVLLRANYAKIYGPIGYGGLCDPMPSVSFWYYFNPNSESSSLEFDTTRNLFPDIVVKKP